MTGLNEKATQSCFECQHCISIVSPCTHIPRMEHYECFKRKRTLNAPHAIQRCEHFQKKELSIGIVQLKDTERTYTKDDMPLSKVGFWKDDRARWEEKACERMRNLKYTLVFAIISMVALEAMLLLIGFDILHEQDTSLWGQFANMLTGFMVAAPMFLGILTATTTLMLTLELWYHSHKERMKKVSSTVRRTGSDHEN